ncbi:MAG: pilus assembly protein TadG-related protein [Dehalococcoidia bacterium]|nr:pilus assembly protein TadG-related protein [Dehalococcoidia bacterium]
MRLARLREESGQSLILGTFSVLALLLVTAFSIDVGLATGQKANLQNAVDAAALAGSIALCALIWTPAYRPFIDHAGVRYLSDPTHPARPAA